MGLDPSAQEKIKKAVKDAGPPYNRRKLKELAKKLHSDITVLDPDTLFNILDTLTDLVPVPPDMVSNVLAEVVKETGIPLTSLEAFVKEIAQDPAYVKQSTIHDFKRLALPGIRALEHFCAVRARFDKAFNYYEDSIETFDPKTVDYHPVIVIKMGLDDGSEQFSFQLDQERLDRFISELIAAQKELKILVDDWSRSGAKGHA